MTRSRSQMNPVIAPATSRCSIHDDPASALVEQIDVRKIIEKQTSFRINLSKLYRPQSNISPLNRAELLDHLQEICNFAGFRRETYFLAQSFIDVALTHWNVLIGKF